MADATGQVALLGVAAVSAAAGVAIDPMVQWAGVPLEVVCWAFAGAACALSFLPAMPRWRAVVALTVGAVLATAGTPLAVHVIELPPGRYDINVAATLGLSVQVVIAPLFGAVPRAVSDLMQALVDRVRGR